MAERKTTINLGRVGIMPEFKILVNSRPTEEFNSHGKYRRCCLNGICEQDLCQDHASVYRLAKDLEPETFASFFLQHLGGA
jgi:hypothetical protein